MKKYYPEFMLAIVLISPTLSSMAAQVGEALDASANINVYEGQITEHTVTPYQPAWGTGAHTNGQKIFQGTVSSGAPQVGLNFQLASTYPDQAIIPGNTLPSNIINVRVVNSQTGMPGDIDGVYAVFNVTDGTIYYDVIFNGDQYVSADTYTITMNAIGWAS